MRSIKRTVPDAHVAIAADFYLLSENPEFQRVMEYLENQTIHRRITDPEYSLLLQGENNLVLHIRSMIERGRTNRT